MSIDSSQRTSPKRDWRYALLGWLLLADVVLAIIVFFWASWTSYGDWIAPTFSILVIGIGTILCLFILSAITKQSIVELVGNSLYEAFMPNDKRLPLPRSISDYQRLTPQERKEVHELINELVKESNKLG